MVPGEFRERSKESHSRDLEPRTKRLARSGHGFVGKHFDRPLEFFESYWVSRGIWPRDIQPLHSHSAKLYYHSSLGCGLGFIHFAALGRQLINQARVLSEFNPSQLVDLLTVSPHYFTIKVSPQVVRERETTPVYLSK